MIRRNRRLQANIKNLRTTHLDDVFGDEIEAKQDKVLIGLVNLAGIPTRREKEKDNSQRELVKHPHLQLNMRKNIWIVQRLEDNRILE